MDCKQALLKLYDYVDRELSDNEYSEVEEHLQQCKHCFGKAEFLRLTKKVVSEKAAKEAVPDYLKDRIVRRIGQLDMGARTGNPGEEDSGFLFFRPWVGILSIAAVTILFVAGIFALFIEGSAGVPGYMVEKYAKMPHPYPNSDVTNQRHLELAFSDPDPSFVPESIRNRAQILSADLENFGPGDMKFVTYEHNGHLLAFYCIDRYLFDPGNQLKKHTFNGQDYYCYASEEGCSFVSWSRNGCVDALVGHMPVTDLITYASQVVGRH
ncbi:MAG: hypothetical protein GF307_08335 [candidate division Zixibacteria bacterium]|nr:hypothetical protein [candidate division Zixibacteria bacterium]